MTDTTPRSAFWDVLAASDPLWAILSDPSRRGRRWDLATFFRTGEREISTLVHQLDQLARPTQSVARGTALDFGCGVGRLSQALARHFETVVGVDVSETMVAHARRLNRHGDRVTYVANPRADLRALGDRQFDLVYTDLVLQHMVPEQALGYVAEFIRMLRPGGYLVFQLPSHRREELTVDVVPMPMHAYNASLRVTALPAEWPPQQPVRVEVVVTNTSTEAWDQRRVGALRVGNHWLDAAGAMLVQDDGRAWLPESMAPGEEARLVLEVTPPDARDALVLELDVVHEGHSWFGDKGSPTLRIPTGDGAEPRPGSRGDAPASDASWSDDLLAPFLTHRLDDGEDVPFPMHGIPRDQIVAFVTSRGAELLHCESDDRGGREWAGYRYFFRTRGRA
jgi:SAM-dependent methyltransferase